MDGACAGDCPRVAGPRWAAGEGAPTSVWGRVWPLRIPKDQVTGKGGSTRPSPPALLPPQPGAGTAATSPVQCRCLAVGRDPGPSLWAGTRPFQSHRTILQRRKLARRQPPSALMEPD